MTPIPTLCSTWEDLFNSVDARFYPIKAGSSSLIKSARTWGKVFKGA